MIDYQWTFNQNIRAYVTMKITKWTKFFIQTCVFKKIP